MKKQYIAPEAGILCFQPVEELAMIDLLLDSGEGEAAEKRDSDIQIKL